MNRYLMLLVILTILLSCAGENTALQREQQRATLQTKLQSWMGQDVNELIRSWGYPQKMNDMPNGNKLLTYQNITQRTRPVMWMPLGTAGAGMAVGGDVDTYHCTITFEADRLSKLVYFNADGNSCY